MSKDKQHKRKSYRKYRAKTVQRSPFDNSPTLIVSDFIVPNAYRDAVDNVLTVYREQGVSFNQSVDRIATLYYGKVNRNKLAEYALRTIANDY